MAWDRGPLVLSAQTEFRNYLRELPNELLETVTADYIWLADLFVGEPPEAFHAGCREACRKECAVRGRPDLYQNARFAVSPSLGEAA